MHATNHRFLYKQRDYKEAAVVTEERNVELKRELLRLRLFVDHFLLPKVRLTYVHLVVFFTSSFRFVCKYNVSIQFA